MSSPIRLLSSLALTCLVGVGSAHASATAADNGANYTTGTWISGSNAGSGFEAWSLGGSGHLIDSSLTTGGGADIGLSFGYSNDAGGFADRTFSAGALADGQSFSVQLVVNFRSGYKGSSLKSGGSDIAKVTISADDYQFNDANIFGSVGATGDWGYSNNTTLTLQATRAGSDLLISVERSGGLSGSFSATVVGGGSALTGFSIYSFGAGTSAENNIYFNNLAVSAAPIPEPAQASLLAGVAVVGLLTMRRRRRRSAL